MQKPQNKRQRTWLLTPLFGVLLFVCLYVAATFFYPGGSQLDINTKGFSWMHNYWCDLLDKTAINGQSNAARPIAIAAMVILCFTLAFFWYIFPGQTDLPKHIGRSIRFFGILSMATNIALFTGFHDAVLMISTLFGLIALAGTLVGLRRLGWVTLFWMGLFNILLVALNNILYYGDGLRYYLPVVQKVTFLSFLIWFCWINLKLFAKMYIVPSGMT